MIYSEFETIVALATHAFLRRRTASWSLSNWWCKFILAIILHLQLDHHPVCLFEYNDETTGSARLFGHGFTLVSREPGICAFRITWNVCSVAYLNQTIISHSLPIFNVCMTRTITASLRKALAKSFYYWSKDCKAKQIAYCPHSC